MSVERRKTGAGPWLTVEAESGGGSLPDWWTVVSTPDSESVEFGGAVIVEGELNLQVGSFVEIGTEVGISLMGNPGSRTLTLTSPATTGVWITDEDAVTGSAAGIYYIPNGTDGEQRIQLAVGSGAYMDFLADGTIASRRPLGVEVFNVGPTGDVKITPTGPPGAEGLEVGDGFYVKASGELGLTLTGDSNALFISANNPQTQDLVWIRDNPGNDLFKLGPTGAVTIHSADPSVIFQAFDPADNQGLAFLTTGLFITEPAAGANVFQVSPTGAVTISPSDTALAALVLKPPVGAIADGDISLQVKAEDGVTDVIALSPDGSLFANADGAVGGSIVFRVSGQTVFGAFSNALNLDHPTSVNIAANADLGFFGATPVAKPTGVAVTAGGIHDALVSLGLIAA